MFERFIQIVSCAVVNLFAVEYSIVCIYHNLFITLYGHLGCFQFLTYYEECFCEHYCVLWEVPKTTLRKDSWNSGRKVLIGHGHGLLQCQNAA